MTGPSVDSRAKNRLQMRWISAELEVNPTTKDNVEEKTWGTYYLCHPIVLHSRKQNHCKRMGSPG